MVTTGSRQDRRRAVASPISRIDDHRSLAERYGAHQCCADRVYSGRSSNPAQVHGYDEGGSREAMSYRIGIIGVGAIGGVVGGMLTRAGHDVTLSEQWPDHVEAMKKGGLRLSGTCG